MSITNPGGRNIVYVLSSVEEWYANRDRLAELNSGALLSTMTVQVLIDGKIDIERLFELLEPTEFTEELPKCVSQKRKFISRVDYAIATIRFHGNIKGVNLNFRRKGPGKTFPRSISITFLYRGRNINVKVCEGNLQTTGANEISQVVSIVNTLLSTVHTLGVEIVPITHYILHTCMINVCVPINIQLDRHEIQRRMISYVHRKFRVEYVIDGKCTNVRLKTTSHGDIPLLLFRRQEGSWTNVIESSELIGRMIKGIKKKPVRNLSLFIFQTGKMITSVKTLKDIIDLIPQVTEALSLRTVEPREEARSDK